MRVEALSERQRHVLEGVAAGKSNGVIAGELGITLDGVKWHVSELLGETGLASRQELADWYRRQTSARAAPASLPMRLAGPLAGPAVRVTVVLLLAAAIATGITIAATGGGRPAAVVVRQERLAYVQDGDIWVKDLPDGAPRQITQRAVGEPAFSAPKWSPSGQWLAFGQQDVGAWIVNADGSGLRRLGGGTWSPVADRLARVTGQSGIVVENVDGSGRKELLPPAAPAGTQIQVRDLAWSPDGDWLAYTLLVQGTTGSPPYRRASMWVMSAAYGAPILVYDAGDPSQDDVRLVGWSPDGLALFFMIDPSFSASAFADGLPLQAIRVLNGATDNRPIPFSPRPATMLLSDQWWTPQPGRPSIMVSDGAGRETWTNKRITLVSWVSGITQDLTPSDVAAIEPAWSPDGARVAYVAAPDAPGVAGGDAAKAAMAQRKIWIMDADGANQRPLTSDAAYRDEYPRWSADGTRIYFVRMDGQDRWSLWVMGADGTDPRLLIDNLSPDVPAGAPAWFGYYGLISWSGALDYWRPPASAAVSATPGPTRTLSLASLGLELQYPEVWSTGAAQEFSTAAAGPAVSCFDCTVLGPPSAPRPYGVEIFAERLEPGCAISCYVGNNAIGVGETPLDPAAQRVVLVAGIDAKRMEIQRQVPLGIAAETGDDTPYREIWTMLPWNGQALFFVAFFREGDTSAETRTRAAYDAILDGVKRSR